MSEEYGTLAVEIIDGIKLGEEEAIRGAAEIARAKNFGLDGTAIIEPYLSRMKQEMPSIQDMEGIKRELRALIVRTSPNSPPGAIFALGKFADRKDVTFLREQLIIHLQALLAVNQSFSSLIVAISDVGPRIISGTTYSYDNIEKNIGDAKAYLKRFGLTFPW